MQTWGLAPFVSATVLFSSCSIFKVACAARCGGSLRGVCNICLVYLQPALLGHFVLQHRALGCIAVAALGTVSPASPTLLGYTPRAKRPET